MTDPDDTPRRIPSEELVIEALKHLNKASSLLFVTGVNHWSTHLIDPKDRHNYETEDTTLDVGEVMGVIKARVATTIRFYEPKDKEKDKE